MFIDFRFEEVDHVSVCGENLHGGAEGDVAWIHGQQLFTKFSKKRGGENVYVQGEPHELIAVDGPYPFDKPICED